MNLELTNALLEGERLHCFFLAQTAEEGLRMAREILPDLVLMDFGLPAWMACRPRDLKANPATRHRGSSHSQPTR
jgi:CheY-like chemotaxis protein